MAWKVGNLADAERQNYVDQLRGDSNVGLLGVASTYWIVFCTFQLLEKFTDLNSSALTLEAMDSVDFGNALKKYVVKAVNMFYETAVDSYDREIYGSFKSTLRSAKFFPKIESKINIRAAGMKEKELPDLVSVCKTNKSSLIKKAS